MGEYGEMYPQLLRLKDGRILYNFTRKSGEYPVGIQAVVNYDEGTSWDFDTDRIIVESRTPTAIADKVRTYGSGGGYGNTVQLPDETLITSYSYLLSIENSKPRHRLEVVRWRLPQSRFRGHRPARPVGRDKPAGER